MPDPILTTRLQKLETVNLPEHSVGLLNPFLAHAFAVPPCWGRRLVQLPHRANQPKITTPALRTCSRPPQHKSFLVSETNASKFKPRILSKRQSRRSRSQAEFQFCFPCRECGPLCLILPCTRCRSCSLITSHSVDIVCGPRRIGTRTWGFFLNTRRDFVWLNAAFSTKPQSTIHIPNQNGTEAVSCLLVPARWPDDDAVVSATSALSV